MKKKARNSDNKDKSINSKYEELKNHQNSSGDKEKKNNYVGKNVGKKGVKENINDFKEYESTDNEERNQVSENTKKFGDNIMNKESSDEEESDIEDEGSDEDWTDDEDRNSTHDPQAIKPQLKLHEDLSEMSFGDLITLKNKLGTKVFSQTAFKNKPLTKLPLPTPPPLLTGNTHRNKKDKNKPVEMSSKLKRKNSDRLRLPASKRYEARDPRFEEMCGELRQDLFEQSYGFLNQIKHNEKMKLLKLAQKEKDPEKKSKINKLIKRMKQQEKSKKQQDEEKEKEKKRRKEESSKVSQGKKPYFLKKSVKKKMREEEKIEEVTKGGGLQKYLKRKEKKMLAKDRKNLSFL